MAMAGHLEEFRDGWKALVATALGLGSGMALYPFVINILAPHLVASMGWTKAEFAMASMASGLSILSFPVVGSLADRFGVRRVGSVGVIATTFSYVAIAMLDGPIGYYLAILMLQLSLGASCSDHKPSGRNSRIRSIRSRNAVGTWRRPG